VTDQHFDVVPVGSVESPLADLSQAPNQGDAGAPPAWLVFESRFADAVRDLHVGDRVIVVTWLHRARRDVLRTYPGDDPSGPVLGVFSLRAPDRPNPIGLHRVRILTVDGLRILVDALEVLNGTPILDVKPVLDPKAER